MRTGIYGKSCIHVANANYSPIIPYWKQYMLKTTMMVDKIIGPTEVGSPISCSPLLNASLGPKLMFITSVPYCPSRDCYLELFFLTSEILHSTIIKVRFHQDSGLHLLTCTSWWCLVVQPLWASLGCKLLDSRVIILSLKECSTWHRRNKSFRKNPCQIQCFYADWKD